MIKLKYNHQYNLLLADLLILLSKYNNKIEKILIILY